MLLALRMKLKSLLKIILSFGMLALVLRWVNFSELKSTLLNVSIGYVIVIVLAYMAGQFISSLKWWLIAKEGGIDVTYGAALKSYFIGMFVNCFGLGMVGGDVTRGLLLSSGKPQKTPAIASVVADRLHGLAVLSLLGLIAMLTLGSELLTPSLRLLLLAIVIGIIGGWFAGPAILLKIIKKDSRFRRKAEQLCHVFPQSPKFLLLITVISASLHLLQIWLHGLMGAAFGVTLSWTTLLTVIPLVNILSSLPISWNGLGVREKSYSFFLTPHILTQEQAVAFGAIWLLAMTLSSAVGGIVSIITRDFEAVAHIEKSEDFALLEKENA